METLQIGAFGLLFQAVGITCIALLLLFLRRTIPRDYLSYFAAGWLCLAVALGALFAALSGWPARWLSTICFFGEYLFGLLLIAGCRNFARGTKITRRDLAFLPPAAVLALLLPHFGADFSLRVIVQAAILAVFFALAFLELEHPRPPRAGPGLSITRVALALLTVSFLYYVPLLVFGSREPLGAAFRAYSSLYDLILEVFLSFGIVILTMEDVHGEVESVNRDLRATRDRLEALVRLDPLTESLTRHAFYSLVEESRGGAPSGCVGVVDVDNLKAINDSYGHGAGDAAIRAVARAIRAVIRSGDLVFRWGGDEFLVVLFGVAEEDARLRLEGVNGALRNTSLPGAPEPRDVPVSWGLAAFSPSLPLERAIEAADNAMYRHKEARKGSPAARAAKPL